MLRLISKGYQFARQAKQTKQSKQIQENKETDEKMKKMQQNKYLDPQTSDALDKYIDSFGNSSFSSLITKISSDITSEHSHFKQICKQAQQNKDLKQLVKDKNSEFMKHVLEFQNSFAPFTQTNIDEKSQSYQSSIKQKKKK